MMAIMAVVIGVGVIVITSLSLLTPLWHTATAGSSGATSTAATTTVAQETSATDSSAATVTDDATTVTGSQTETSMSYTPARKCRLTQDQHRNISTVNFFTPYVNRTELIFRSRELCFLMGIMLNSIDLLHLPIHLSRLYY